MTFCYFCYFVISAMEIPVKPNVKTSNTKINFIAKAVSSQNTLLPVGTTNHLVGCTSNAFEKRYGSTLYIILQATHQAVSWLALYVSPF